MEKKAIWRVGFWVSITLIFLYDRRYLIEKAGLPHFIECAVVRVGLLLGLTTFHLRVLLPRFARAGRYGWYAGRLLVATFSYVALQHAYDWYLFRFIIGDTAAQTFWSAFPHNFVTTLWYLAVTLAFHLSLTRVFPNATEPVTPYNDENDLTVPLEPDVLRLKSGARTVDVSAASILFVQGLKDYSVIHTATGKIVVHGNLKTVAGMLPPADFVRLHKSYIVARSQVTRVEKERLFIGELAVPIGRTYRQKVQLA